MPDEETAAEWEHLCNSYARQDIAGHSFTYYIYARYATFIYDKFILARSDSLAVNGRVCHRQRDV